MDAFTYFVLIVGVATLATIITKAIVWFDEGRKF